MIYREDRLDCLGNLAKFALCIIGLVLGLETTRGQQVTTLIQFTNVWKYDQSGAELGTAWRTNDYDDSSWPSGAGLLGVDNNVPGAYPPHLTPLTVSDSLITYYFRATFEFLGETNGVSLIASNYIDDGAVIYLNGREAGRFRVPANQTSTTRATSGNVEGALDVLSNINSGLLRQGTNLMAVELHQGVIPQTDLSWGMKLVAFRPTTLSITNQPQSQNVTVGNPVTFQVGVSGGPAYYQWQKDGVNVINGGAISGVTSNVLRISSAQIAHSGEYRVIVANAINSVTSNPVKLTALLDATGPRLLSATVRASGLTNQILVTFSEPVQSGSLANSSSTNIANFRVTRCGTGDDVIISNATPVGPQILLRVGVSNWVYRDCYQLTVNNVTDLLGNRIAPDSRVPISWPVIVDLVTADAPWSFHSSAIIDSGIYNEDWTGTNFIENIWWAPGNGVFYGGAAPTSPCLGDVLTLAGFQPEPMLFRTKFQWPSSLGSTAQLQTRFMADDGMVLYLNGAEIWRTNVAAGTGPLSATNRATASVIFQRCTTNVITVANLAPGLNCLAVGVLQSTDTSLDSLFGLTMSGTGVTIEPPVDSPLPTLNVSPHETESVRLWWNGGGYALESTTNLTGNAASYPFGPWQEVSKMSNPYTNSLASPARFFRLKK